MPCRLFSPDGKARPAEALQNGRGFATGRLAAHGCERSALGGRMDLSPAGGRYADGGWGIFEGKNEENVEKL